MKYQIISDSACDLSREAEGLGVRLVPFQIVFDDERSLKENLELDVRDFYRFLMDNPNVFPKTALPSVQDYADVFYEYAKKNIPMLCVCISSKISGSYNSANIARELVLEEYPKARIEIIDSHFATVLEGLLVLECVRLRDGMISLEESAARLRETVKTGRIFFTVGSVDYLKAGGRMSKFTGTLTSTLGIKPVITMKDGKLISAGITLSRKKSIEKVRLAAGEYLASIKDDLDRYNIVVGYGYEKSEAERLRDEFTEMLKEISSADVEISVRQIGSTIGVHTGPHPLGIGILRKVDMV